jgi:6-phosphogluconate dehydrogenase (decarboxylating)
MELGMVGLGRMGANMSERLVRGGHRVVGHDPGPDADLDVSAPVITLSLLRRLRSREQEPFADRLLAMMRHGFGGHAIKTATEKERKPA